VFQLVPVFQLALVPPPAVKVVVAASQLKAAKEINKDLLNSGINN
jgi:hypothetical protein